ncbi:MAG: L,D-transpeptidase family protein [Aestuariivita sp.]|nr:L,D-transpeptidase family protein [Aestuariivita sp.]
MNRRNFNFVSLSILGIGLIGCSSGSRIRWQDSFPVTSILVNKGERELFLLNDGFVLKKYNFDLGFNPIGGKRVEGDGKTPEGVYYINRRNPNSNFHLSLGISYPNDEDVKNAQALGKDPGGDIFIHGQPNSTNVTREDWTEGCIAVSNDDIEEIYRVVKTGTPIIIRP